MKKCNLRISLLSIAMILIGALLLFNVLLLDIKGTTLFTQKNFKDAIGVSIQNETIASKRGTIYDCNGEVIATDMTVYKIIFILSDSHKKYDSQGNIVPDYVVDKRYTADAVAEIINADADYIYSRLNEDYYQVEIGEYGNRISYDEKIEIELLNLPGIYFESRVTRYYPNSVFASHLIGYCDITSEGNTSIISGTSGIEKILDDQLSGSTGYKTYYSDAYGNEISGGLIDKKEAVNGNDVYTTLNTVIQKGVEEYLNSTMELSYVDKCWSIIMDAKTGAILGYGSRPSYDPNYKNIVDFNDYIAAVPYEPGSTMKSFTYAITMDIGKYDNEEKFNSNDYYVSYNEKGEPVRTDRSNYYIGVINNALGYQYGWVTYGFGYSYSLNVGTVTLLEEKIGKTTFIEYMDKFGFYKPVDVFGINEGNNYGEVDYSNALSLACATFGSGNTVNALQLMQAYSSFANQGTMIKPYIIDKIVDSVSGEVIYQSERIEVGTPIKASTAAQVLELMGVNGQGKNFAINGVSVGVKTGTAPVADENGGYGAKTIHSAMIAIPYDDPVVFIYTAYQDNNIAVRKDLPNIRNLERAVANALGLINNKSEDDGTGINEFKLQNYINQAAQYVLANNKMLNTVLIGDGSLIIKQYPEAGRVITSDQKVFLVTNGENIVMPNMKGWSRKDVTAFWDLTGISVQLEGYGYVYYQNIAQGTQIDKNTLIQVKLNNE